MRISLVCTRFVVNPKPREPSWAHPSSERRHGRLQPARHPGAGAEAPDAPVLAIPARAGAPAARSGGSGHPGAGGGRRHGGCGHPGSSTSNSSPRCRRQATLPPWLPLPFAASATPASSHQWPSAPAPWSPWEGGAARLPAALARGSGRAQAGSTRSATAQAAHLQ